jgi:hypothetical protein
MDESVTTSSLLDTTITEYQKEREQLKIDQDKFNKEKTQMETSNDITDVIRLNAGGEIIMTTRATLTRVPKSTLALMFNGRWQERLPKDFDENIFLDYDPVLFRHLIEQLQTLENGNSPVFYPPLSPSLIVPFEKMLRKLGFNAAAASSSSDEIIALNVGGEQMITRQNTLTRVPQSKLAAIILRSKVNNKDANGNLFLDHDPKLFRHLLDQLRQQKQATIHYFDAPSNEKKESFNSMLNSFDLSSK